MKLLRTGYGLREMRRFAAITGVLVKHGFGDLVDRRGARRQPKPGAGLAREPSLKGGFPSPRRLRLVLEELGPSFVKLGQLMSTRADIFPPDYIEELKKLQDQVPPTPFPAIRQVLETELKKPLDRLFLEFNSQPVAAASVGQVHVAVLFTGEKVAVKVIRPGIDRKIRDDIRLMYFLAGKIEKSFEVGRILGAVNLVREFERVIFRELDMLIEAGSIEKFACNFKEVAEIYIPRVYWDYTTKSVLVMEHIDGVKMDEVDAIRGLGIDPKDIALIGLRSFSRQLMQYGFFHADPHPGNTLVMADGRVSLVDFGITGYLDDEMMREIANLFLGYAEHDYNLVMAALLDAGLISDETMDLKAFRNDLKDMSESFYGRSLKNISVKDVYDQVMALILKYRIRLPRNLLLLLKTFVQTEALGKILGSDASLLEVTRPFAKEMLKRGYDAKSMFRNLGRDARILADYGKTIPKYVNDLLRVAATGKQRLELDHTGFEEFSGHLEKGANRLTIGVIIAASIVAAALVLNSAEKVMEFSAPVAGIARISLTTLFGLAGYVIATILGIWLIVSIFRSGKL